MLKSFVNTLLLQVAKGHTKKVTGLDYLVLPKKLGILPKKALNTIHCTMEYGVHTVLHPSLSRRFKKNYCLLWSNMYSNTLFVTKVSRKDNRCTQTFATNFVGHDCS